MKENEMTNKGKEMVDCFWCGKKSVCRFEDGKGYVVLGEKKDGTEFGNHAMCDNCRKKTA